MKFIDRTGEENYNNFGTLMKIVEYKNAHDMVVEFQDEHKVKVHTEYKHFKKGGVKNPYDKTICNVGYIGVGKYEVSNNRKHTKVYGCWKRIIERCYDPYILNEDKNACYRDVFVCEEWHNFQNFAKWFYKNYYEIKNETMCIDKDILIKGNKIYNPSSCIFVPNRINSLFVKCDKMRSEYPVGVYYDKDRNKLRVMCCVCEDKKKKNKHLGRFPLNKPFRAFYAYKQFKENYIKQVADEYKDLIPEKLYKAMYSYEVEIND